MWTYLYVAVGSGSCAFAVACCIGLRLKARLVERLTGVHSLLVATADLENRRVAMETGRDQLVRASAGRPARVVDGMATKPGVYARYLRDSVPTKKNDAEAG